MFLFEGFGTCGDHREGQKEIEEVDELKWLEYFQCNISVLFP